MADGEGVFFLQVSKILKLERVSTEHVTARW
jgi:hypothetical protein